MGTKIQSALVADQIVMDFQPVVNLKTLDVVYYEALVRLVIEDKVIYPNDFIPSLEKAEDMNLLDRHVIGKTLSMMHQYPGAKLCRDKLVGSGVHRRQVT